MTEVINEGISRWEYKNPSQKLKLIDYTLDETVFQRLACLQIGVQMLQRSQGDTPLLHKIQHCLTEVTGDLRAVQQACHSESNPLPIIYPYPNKPIITLDLVGKGKPTLRHRLLSWCLRFF